MQNNQEKELILLKDLGMLFPKESSKRTRHFGLYKCFCNKEFNALIDNVKRGQTKSCGCLSIIKNNHTNIKHNLSRHRLYKTWAMMMDRCYNITAHNYKYYGGKGVTVCQEWHSVTNFIEDMYPSYVEGLTLDRINTDNNYEKSNCRWSSIETQNRNKRKIMATNTSGYRGVSWHSKTSKWVAKIKIYNKTIYLGLFNEPIEAAKAYDRYVIQNNLENTLNF